MIRLRMWLAAKKNLKAARGAASQIFVGQVKCRDDFMKLVRKRPEKEFASQIWFYESQLTSVLVQPSLCAQCNYFY